MNTATFAGLAGMSLGIAGCKSEGERGSATPAADADAAIDYSKYEVHPGQLDEYSRSPATVTRARCASMHCLPVDC